jgi:hypothetical protein
VSYVRTSTWGDVHQPENWKKADWMEQFARGAVTR